MDPGKARLSGGLLTTSELTIFLPFLFRPWSRACHFPNNCFLLLSQESCVYPLQGAEVQATLLLSLPCGLVGRPPRPSHLVGITAHHQALQKRSFHILPQSLRNVTVVLSRPFWNDSLEVCQLSSFPSLGIRSWDTNLIECNLDQELKLFVSRHSARFSPEVPGEAWVWC